jgi:hypothetical protein
MILEGTKYNFVVCVKSFLRLVSLIVITHNAMVRWCKNIASLLKMMVTMAALGD